MHYEALVYEKNEFKIHQLDNNVLDFNFEYFYVVIATDI